MRDNRHSSLTGLDEMVIMNGQRVKHGLFTLHKEDGVAGDAIHPTSWMNGFEDKTVSDIMNTRRNLRNSWGCYVIPDKQYDIFCAVAKENKNRMLVAFAPEVCSSD